MTADHVDAVPRPSRGTVRVRRALWVVRLGVWCSVIAGWFVFFAPVGLGGGTTFTIVQGASMQPALYDGDLVLTRQQDSYRIGDLIVYPIDTNKAVIHRIIDGNATDGWITQGDNNDRPDAWKVPNDGILGKYWFMIPDVGHALEWLRKHPLYFGALVSGVVILLNLVRRRSRPHPLLAAAVAEGRRGPRLSGRPVEQVLVFVVACLSGVLSFISLILLFSAGILLSPSAGLMAAILLGSVLAGHWLLRRLADGRGVPEPTASQYVLGTRCWDVDDLPTPDHVLDVPNARALRDLTEKRRMAVLRHTAADGTVTYLTIDRDGVGHRWRVPALSVAHTDDLGFADETPVAFQLVDPEDSADLVVPVGSGATRLPWPPPKPHAKPPWRFA